MIENCQKAVSSKSLVTTDKLQVNPASSGFFFSHLPAPNNTFSYNAIPFYIRSQEPSNMKKALLDGTEIRVSVDIPVNVHKRFKTFQTKNRKDFKTVKRYMESLLIKAGSALPEK